VLIALLVPAVQKVREAAARRQCDIDIHALAGQEHAYRAANNKFFATLQEAIQKGFTEVSYFLPPKLFTINYATATAFKLTDDLGGGITCSLEYKDGQTTFIPASPSTSGQANLGNLARTGTQELQRLMVGLPPESLLQLREMLRRQDLGIIVFQGLDANHDGVLTAAEIFTCTDAASELCGILSRLRPLLAFQPFEDLRSYGITMGDVLVRLPCDYNADGAVNADDINLITGSRNSPAAFGDPRDADHDGMITANDARACVLRCTKPGCAR